MDLAAIQAQMQAYGFGSDTVPQQTAFINAAYREIHSRSRWPFLEAIDSGNLQTVVGTSNYDLPDTMGDWRNLDAIRITRASDSTDSPKMEWMDSQELFDKLARDDPEVSTPRAWTMYASQIWLYPTPDDVFNLTIYYIQEPADLSADDDTPVVPSAYHDAIVYGAICGITFRERDWIGLELWQARFDTAVQRLEDEYLVRQRQTSLKVGKSGFFNERVWYPAGSPGF